MKQIASKEEIGDNTGMPRFFTDRKNINDYNIIITGEDVIHIKNVLRMQVGDKLEICDAQGFEYMCVIAEFVVAKGDEPKIICNILSKNQSITEPMVKITLFQGVPKGDKFENIIQKSVELGVYEIIPVITKRTVVKIEKKSGNSLGKSALQKIERYNKISLEAAKQSNRGIIPKIHGFLSFKDAVKEWVSSSLKKFDLIVFAYENERVNSLRSYIENQNGEIKKAAVFIGPEGGFDDDEVKCIIDAGIKPVTLGPRILRTETAGPAVISMLMYGLQ